MSAESQLIWQPPWGAAGWWLSLAAGLVVVVVGLLSTAGRPPWVRAALGALRSLAVVGVLVLLWRPTWQHADVTHGRDRIAVLVDASSSMRLPTRAGGPSRAEATSRFLHRADGVLKRWSTQRDVERYTFAERLRSAGAKQPAPGEATRRASGRTDLLGALEQVRGRYRGRQLAGVVVLSDGRDTARLREGLSPALKARLRALDVPVNVVPIGDDAVRDVSVMSVVPDDLSFVRNVSRVRAVVRALGTTAAVDVSLWIDGNRVQTLRARGGEEREVTFEFTPTRVGTYTGRVVADALPGEATRDNNVRRFVLRVVRDRVRVLQIAGRPSWDVRFLRQHFKRNPNVDLVSFFILRTHRNRTYAAPHELSLIRFPAEELFSKHLDSFDLVVMQDFERYTADVGVYLDNIAAWVRRGGAVAVLGGEQTLTYGGFRGSQLESVLPVALLPPGPPSSLLDEAPFRPRWTALAAEHPITRDSGGTDDADVSPDRLATLPPLQGVNKVLRAHSDAAVLAVHPRLRTRGGKPMPVVAVRDVGRGRSMVFLTDTSWRWRFDMASDNTGLYDAFWRRVVRYLIGDPEFARLRVLAARRPYAASRTVQVAIHASDLKRQPLAQASVAWRLLSLEKGAPHPLQSGEGKTDASGRLVLRLGPLPPGSYRVEAKGVLGARQERARGVFVVEGAAPELARVDPDPALLRAVAEATGGRVLSRPDALGGARLHPPRVIRLDNVRQTPLLGSLWWLLLVITAALAGEWILRRRFALA